MVLARGDQVRLPSGRGVGIVVENESGESDVFVGMRVGDEPIIERYVDVELFYTGRHYSRVAKAVRRRLTETKRPTNGIPVVYG